MTHGRLVVTAALLLTAAPRTGYAQLADAQPPATVRYGKWIAAALFGGFTALGVQEHERANDRFRELVGYCEDTGPCRVGPDGRYTNSEAEARYREVARGDRAARGWLVAGQVALLTSVTLFVIELRRGRNQRAGLLQPFVAFPGGGAPSRVGVSVVW